MCLVCVCVHMHVYVRACVQATLSVRMLCFSVYQFHFALFEEQSIFVYLFIPKVQLLPSLSQLSHAHIFFCSDNSDIIIIIYTVVIKCTTGTLE